MVGADYSMYNWNFTAIDFEDSNVVDFDGIVAERQEQKVATRKCWLHALTAY